MSAGPLISASGVGVRYGAVAALADASISIHRGEVWAIVGANGSGKSTLLRALAGIARESQPSGSIAYAAGADLARQRAFVPQRPEVAAPFTAREVVRLGRYAQGPNEAAVDRALAEVGLAHRSDKPFHELSGGERQRVAVARALAQMDSGGVLFLDEPFSGVDPAVSEIQDIIRMLRQAGLAILITDHNVRETLNIVDRAYLIFEGRVRRHGTKDFLVNDEEARRLYLGEGFTM